GAGTIPAATVGVLVAQQSKKMPAASALADAPSQFTCRGMRDPGVALAYARRERGVQPGDSVAVALPRSVFLTLALHGIVEAGAAWLPHDTGYPNELLRMMLADAPTKPLIPPPPPLGRFHAFPGSHNLSHSPPLPSR
ncbi:AMP-binding protein, partial [Salmonella enterica]|uniref:AMP-binding protein n=1 Tax=Salmonella enterica TaxID=28901 RepID=UPI00398C60BB